MSSSAAATVGPWTWELKDATELQMEAVVSRGCVQCLRMLVLEDRFYAFICSVCSSGLEKCPPSQWLDTVHIYRSNLNISYKKYFGSTLNLRNILMKTDIYCSLESWHTYPNLKTIIVF